MRPSVFRNPNGLLPVWSAVEAVWRSAYPQTEGNSSANSRKLCVGLTILQTFHQSRVLWGAAVLSAARIRNWCKAKNLSYWLAFHICLLLVKQSLWSQKTEKSTNLNSRQKRVRIWGSGTQMMVIKTIATKRTRAHLLQYRRRSGMMQRTWTHKKQQWVKMLRELRM